MTPTRKPVVYLIAQPTVSRKKAPPPLDPLYKHGDVVTLIFSGEAPSFEPRKCFESMEERFKNFDPDIDYIAWVGGDHLAAVMIGMLLAELELYCFRWLRYERHRLPSGERVDDGATYVPVEIDLADPLQVHQLLSGEESSEHDVAQSK